MLERLYATGIRVSEIASLRVGDVDTEERLLRIILGKGRRDRVVPLTRTAAAAIERYSMKARPTLHGKKRSSMLFLGVPSGVITRRSANDIVHPLGQEGAHIRSSRATARSAQRRSTRG